MAPSFFQLTGLYLPLFERDCVWISVGLEPVILESSDCGGGAVVGGDGGH